MNKYICIHGHFYQPPRENAWIDAIEQQSSAGEPYHDWNERINVESYRSNANARLLDSQKLIRRISNNYEYISFNFGPTLLSWLEKFDIDTYQKIIAADKKSVQARGHGNALAQVYNHIIQPLANPRDNETQIIWGLKDFEYRFGRKAEGIWLAETAVDTQTLEFLAENEVKFTVLSPNQVKSVRTDSDAEWEPKDYHSIDTRRAYRCNLPSGKTIDLFYYDGNTAKDVAFNRLLNSGQVLGDRLLQPFDGENQLVHIATDGESYGHHHKFGEMALAYALEYLQQKDGVELTNYATFLEQFPAKWETQIHEKSSWSCAHGVERWRSDCGCHTGGEAGWNQEWRAPLRAAFDYLRDELIPLFEKESKGLLKDPWAARNAYVDVLIDSKNIDSFLNDHQAKELAPDEKTKALQLLEMQKLSMFMYTSCGWFFNEVSGIETVQILQYADKAIHLANNFSNTNFEKQFLVKLKETPSNIFQDTKQIFEKEVASRRMSQEEVVWNILVKSILKDESSATLFGYHFEFQDINQRGEGENKLWFGNINLTSISTLEKSKFRFHFYLRKLEEIKGRIIPFSMIETPDQLDAVGADDEGFETLIVEVEDIDFEPKIYTEKDALFEVNHSFYQQLEEQEEKGLINQLKAIRKLNSKTKKPISESIRILSNLLIYKELESKVRTTKSLEEFSIYLSELNDISFTAEQSKSLSASFDDFLSKEIRRIKKQPDFIGSIIQFLEELERINLPVSWYQTQNELLPLKNLKFLPHQRDNVIRVYSKLGVVYPFPLIQSFAF